jgi:hypothetical protein
MMDITFKSIVHALRLSGIEILKNVLLPSQLPTPVSSSKEEDVHGSKEEVVHDRKEDPYTTHDETSQPWSRNR